MQSTSPEGLSFGFVSMCNLCILLQIFYLRLQPVQEDGEVAERNNPACARETFVLELSSKGLGSQLLTPLALVTNVTARLCCRFIKLVPAEPSIPPHQLANMLFPAGADLPALRISTFSAVVSFQAQVFSSSSFIPHPWPADHCVYTDFIDTPFRSHPSRDHHRKGITYTHPGAGLGWGKVSFLHSR